jgi:beta-glucosidase
VRRCFSVFLVFVLLLPFLIDSAPVRVDAQTFPFQNPSLPLDTRVNDLLSRLTASEKVALLHQYQPAIARLGIPSFRTGTEALHGVAWLGTATVFPQAIGLGSTWDPALIKQVGSAVGDEVRGYNFRNRAANGLNVWAPVVDLLRDPRAGRNEEGYGVAKK